MNSTPLPLSAGRTAFGDDPAAYDAARPPYPVALCGLRSADLIGPGTGLLTAPLLEFDPLRLRAVEPDPRLADHLETRLGPGYPAFRTRRCAR